MMNPDPSIMRKSPGECGGKAALIFANCHQLRLLFFGGKGGVGKTTCATATAINLANQCPQSSILLASSDPAHSLADCLADYIPPANVTILEFDAGECLARFMEKHSEHLREIASRGTFLDAEDTGSFLDLSLPGLDELMAFLEILRWVEEKRYDCIVIDTAPTGHTLRLLDMPGFLQQWLAALDALLAKHRYMKQLFKGIYQRDELDTFLLDLSASIQRMEKIMTDPEQCCFVPVMLAESMSCLETERLLGKLQQAQIPITDIIVNKLFPDNSCPVCLENRLQQIRVLEQFTKSVSGYCLWGIPMSPTEVRGQAPLENFWTGMFPIESLQPVAGGFSAKLIPQVAAAGKPPPSETELLFFVGKGGVGKTTLASATALRMAHDFPARKTLIFSTDPAHSLSDCFDLPIGASPTAVMQGLTALEIDAEAEFNALKEQYAGELEKWFERMSSHLDITFDREVMERIMDLAPPGLDEVMALTRIMELLGQGHYDVFVFDSAPTGHLLRLLEAPELIEQWLKSFFALFLKYKRVFKLPGITKRLVQMSKDLKQLRSLLRDGRRSKVYVVAILTEMAFLETTDLVEACEDRLGVQVPVCFLNLATPASECLFCSASFKEQTKIREKFKTTFAAKQQTVVYRQGAPKGLAQLTALGKAMYVK